MIRLSDHFTYMRLLRFTMPSVLMMVFLSTYNVVDGFFVAHFVGVTPFAAINLVFPFAMLLGCFGFMFGSGGSALVAMRLGEGKPREANRTFSLLIYTGLAAGAVLAALGMLSLETVARRLGADDVLLPYCLLYGHILLLSLPANILQHMFQSLMITAEKPGLGLRVTILSGLANIALDALFILVFGWGLAGAAVATAISECIGGFVPLLYFARENSSLLRLGTTGLDLRALWNTCTNGLSEFVTNISMSVVAMLYNWQLLRLAGETGIAAYGAVMYVSFTFISIFLGYALGSAPVVSFHYGAGNRAELRSLRKKSLVLTAAAGLLLAALSSLLASPLAYVFGADDAALYEMTQTAFRFYALSLLANGFSIWGSAFFTALNNGTVSAAIAFLRTLVFEAAAVLILPGLFGLSGVWYSLPAAETLAALVTFALLAVYRGKYGY